jgi:hypothetical protein
MGGVLTTIISFIWNLFICQDFQQRRKCQLVIVFNNEINRRKIIRDEQVLIMLLIELGILIIYRIQLMSFNTYDAMTRLVMNKSSDRKTIETFVKILNE